VDGLACGPRVIKAAARRTPVPYTHGLGSRFCRAIKCPNICPIHCTSKPPRVAELAAALARAKNCFLTDQSPVHRPHRQAGKTHCAWPEPANPSSNHTASLPYRRPISPHRKPCHAHHVPFTVEPAPDQQELLQLLARAQPRDLGPPCAWFSFPASLHRGLAGPKSRCTLNGAVVRRLQAKCGDIPAPLPYLQQALFSRPSSNPGMYGSCESYKP